jgi:hypothetical protein
VIYSVLRNEVELEDPTVTATEPPQAT